MSAAPSRLVHLGDRFAVLDKPAGLSLSTPRGRAGEAAQRLAAALPAHERSLLEGRDLFLVHRLDVSTTGLVVLALDAEMHVELARAFAERRVAKLYLALVWGRPRPRAGSFESALAPDRADRRRMLVDPAGKPARSDWYVVASAAYVSLVALWARTGRTHQLRVHLAAAGHPVVGDDLYGGPRHRGVRGAKLRSALAAERALLHAWRLELPGVEPSRFEAPPPPDFSAARRAARLALADAEELWQSAPKSDPTARLGA